jgi:hypothetical protein
VLFVARCSNLFAVAWHAEDGYAPGGDDDDDFHRPTFERAALHAQGCANGDSRGEPHHDRCEADRIVLGIPNALVPKRTGKQPTVVQAHN